METCLSGVQASMKQGIHCRNVGEILSLFWILVTVVYVSVAAWKISLRCDRDLYWHDLWAWVWVEFQGNNGGSCFNPINTFHLPWKKKSYPLLQLSLLDLKPVLIQILFFFFATTLPSYAYQNSSQRHGRSGRCLCIFHLVSSFLKNTSPAVYPQVRKRLHPNRICLFAPGTHMASGGAPPASLGQMR